MSKGSSRRRLTVDWDSMLRLWKKRPEQDGFFELLEPYSETWPASGSMRNGHAWQRRRSALPTVVSESSSMPGRLLPTPTASNPNEGESVESWEARRQRNLAKGINGNGQGTPLGIAVKLLPTPRTSDTNGAGVHGDGGMDLRTAVSLLPTPRATRGGSATETMYSLGGARTDESRPQGEVLLPTPSASFASTTANFRPDGTPYGEGYGMTLLDAVRLLPTTTASDGERTSSSYGRGNPTLTGAITSLPSDDGNASSDDRPLGPLTLWDV